MSDTFEHTAYGAMASNISWSGEEILNHTLDVGSDCCFTEHTLEESLSIGHKAVEDEICDSFEVWKVHVTVTRVK